MLNQQDFLKKYNIATEVYDSTKLVWQDLEAIFHDYSSFRNELEPTAVMLFNKFMLSHGVHSVRYRVKDPEHLIEKIIRKKAKDNKSNITLENYKEEVNDLIGLRALHLFKPDWEPINEFIRKT